MVGAAMHNAVPAEGQAGRHEALGIELLDVVERRSPDDGLLPQHDRLAHRDHRQPDADRRSRSSRRSSCRTRPALSDRAAGVALPPVDRLLGDRELRGARPRVAQPGELPVQHLPDGEELDRAREQGQLDADTAPRIAAQAAPAAAAGTRRRQTPRPATNRDASVAAGEPWRQRTPRTSRSCCAIRPRAIRAGYILPADQPDFPTATKFVNSLLKTGVTVHKATAAFSAAGKSIRRARTS